MSNFDIPIITYHKVEPNFDIGITSRHPLQFEKDMQILNELGYQPITFIDLARNNNLPTKPIIITFDDGYESVYQRALPVMQSFGFRAVVFISVDYIGKLNNWDVQLIFKKYRHLNEEQLQELKAAGFEIGSHACTHRLLTTLKKDELIKEFSKSKLRLEEITGGAVVSVCYPFGIYDEQTLAAARAAGYHYGLASIYYKRISSDYRTLALRRINIYRIDSARVFIKKLKNKPHSPWMYRDWCIQLGGRATVWYQGFFNRKSDRK